MAMPPGLQEFMSRAAAFLHVPHRQLLGTQDVINEILRFFESGELARYPEREDDSFPRFIRPRLLAVRDTLLAVRTVTVDRHLVLPTVREAFVTFTVEDEPYDIPPWQTIRPEEWDQLESHGNVAHTFTSALPTEENLADFGKLVSSPGPTLERPDGMPTLDEWMIQQRARGRE